MVFSSWIRSWKRSIERRWALYQIGRQGPNRRRRAPRLHLEALEDRWLLSSYLVTSAVDDGSKGTLRDAINQANLTGTITEIDFKIGTLGTAQTINLTSQLPTLTANGVFINGLSQNSSGFTKLLIELNGTKTGDGLLLGGSSCIVSGLIIENFTNGIEVVGDKNTIGGSANGARNVISGNSKDGVLIDASTSGTQVQGNFIGTDTTSTKPLANGNGIEVQGPLNTIGGSGAALNVISGNTGDGILIDNSAASVKVQGNYIGTDITGENAVGNGTGIEVNSANNNLIGGATGLGNVISGNKGDGVKIDGSASGVQVQGNYIGTDSTGENPLGNSVGIEVNNTGNTVGGATNIVSNTISGNTADGALIDASVSAVTLASNFIGTDQTGTKSLGNGVGVLIKGSNNTIGGAGAASNVISGNKGDGVFITGTASGVAVQGNYIGLNGGAIPGSVGLANGTGIEVNSSGNAIGGTSGLGNFISGNAKGDGVKIDGSASGVTVQGNYIGTDITGESAVANSVGIEVNNTGNTAGGATNIMSNTISGNTADGVLIDASVSGVTLQNNYVGVDQAGTKGVGNSIGVLIRGSNNTIGGSAAALNVISGNTGDGVFITGSASGVAVQGNYIGLNGGVSSSSNTPGSVAVANGTGIEVNSSNNTIGGLTGGNFISGNTKGDGVKIDGSASGVEVLGNNIGTDVTNAKAVANSVGIEIANTGNTIGGATTIALNYIFGNTADGVLIDAKVSAVQIQANDIGTNSLGATGIGNGVGILVKGSNNTIGGSLSDLNVISGNTGDGIDIASSVSGVVVQGNYIGTDVNGKLAVGNSVGIEVSSSSNTIGGTAAGAGNLISANTADGIKIDNSASGVVVQGNSIGTDVTGLKALGNGTGVYVSANKNTIGGTTGTAANVISGNTADGVYITSTTSSVVVEVNYIGLNGGATPGTAGVGNSIGVEVAGSNNTIGGLANTTTGAIARNFISGNQIGVKIDGSASGVQVQGNYIGTDVTGKNPVGNSTGVQVFSSKNTIGGGAGNTISGNATGDGVMISTGVSGVLVQGNWIGTDISGTVGLGNLNGVEVKGSNNTVYRNTLSGNSHDGVLIDSGATGVTVQGNNVGTDTTGKIAVANFNGIEVAAINNTIGGTTSGAGNQITGNTNDGILIDATASGVQVQGNRSLTVALGTAKVANLNGIEVQGSNNTIGGTITGAANTISGNAGSGILIDGSSKPTGVQIQGNYIGTSSANQNGVMVSTGTFNTIGGTVAGAGNVISGNTADGVLILGTNVQVQGNFIGTNTTGASALANGIGVEINGANNTVGGTLPGAMNVIAGNKTDGVKIDNVSGVQVQGNFIGVNSSGTKGLGNSIGVDVFGSNNTIGGLTNTVGAVSSAARNIISANSTAGIYLESTAKGNQVQGNYVGTDVSGAVNLSLGKGDGVDDFGTGNVLGGTAVGAGNLVSGNKNGIYMGFSGTQVQGNYVGVAALTPFGVTLGAANANGVVEAATGVNILIGGRIGAASNTISGNTTDGVSILKGASGVLLQGNYIGTDYYGTSAVANGTGVEMAAIGGTIGGTVNGAGNVIAFNTGDGLKLDSTTSGVLVQGNYIGTNFGAGSAQSNSIGVEDAGIKNIIGGTSARAANFIESNTKDGVLIDTSSSNVQVMGNYIGTSPNNGFLGNSGNGVEVAGIGATIGGSATGARNVISANLGSGILIDSTATGTQVQGNFVGTGIGGTNAIANSVGITVLGAHNTIGGTAPGARNVIGGNTGDGVSIGNVSGVLVLGNEIGLDYIYGGNYNVGNGTNGVEVAGSGNIIGGTTAGARNVISFNNLDGVMIDGVSGVLVEGNFIGTSFNGENAAANLANGVEVKGNTNTIGGTSAGTRNIISGNSNDGVKIDSTASGVLVEGNFIGTDAAGTQYINNLNGVEVAGSSNTIGGTSAGTRNLLSGNASGDGVLIDGKASGVLVEGNYIGTDVTGNYSLRDYNGVEIGGSASGNIIGGTSSGARNIISGNNNYGVFIDGGSGITGNQVQGNYIGLNAAGTARVGNGSYGLDVGNGQNTIGGTTAATRNIISANGNDGVYINASGVTVEGNYIGTNAAGSQALGNGTNGIEVVVPGANFIGGTASGAGNLISGYGTDGVEIDATVSGVQVLGNTIGLNAAGTAALPTGTYGIAIYGSKNTIGGATTGAGNVISSNGNSEVYIDTPVTGILVAGNSIGVNLAGNVVMSDAYGVNVNGNANTIGGSAAAARNVISGNYSRQIWLESSASANDVWGNYIGTNPSGTAAVTPIQGYGIEVDGAGNTIGVVVTSSTAGVATVGAGNVISGNSNDGIYIASSGTLVAGNNIGTNAAGNGVIGNGNFGIEDVGSSNTLGGPLPGAGNTIGGNVNDGIYIEGQSGTLVQGNYVGTDATGKVNLGNGAPGSVTNGIEVNGSNNTIGGTATGAGNTVSFNAYNGIMIDSSGSNTGNPIQGNTVTSNGRNGIEVDGPSNKISGNLVNSNFNDGIYMNGNATGIALVGNSIGTDITGTKALGNGSNGIEMNNASSNTIGGTTAGAGNLISANGTNGLNGNDGILLDDAASGISVLGNFIGVNGGVSSSSNTPGTVAMGNLGDGIALVNSQNDVLSGNLVSANGNDGIYMDGNCTGNSVLGNSIGTDVSGTLALGNSGNGVEIVGPLNTLGGTTSAALNVISANLGDGVLLENGGGTGNLVQGNYIGVNGGVSSKTNTPGTVALANGQNGVEIAGYNNTLGGTVSGAGNVISGNVQDGVQIGGGIYGGGYYGNLIAGNDIGVVVGGGSGLGNGGNGIDEYGYFNTIGGSTAAARNVISANAGNGVQLDPGSNGGGNSDTLAGNLIGTDVKGGTPLSNGGNGIEVQSGGAIIGNGSYLANVISGNLGDGILIDNGVGSVQVVNSYIGTDINGANPLGNNGNGIEVDGPYATIGGTVSATVNVISGNKGDGVLIASGVYGVSVEWDNIGTNKAGSAAVGNGLNGVEVAGNGNTIGATVSGAGNVISGNANDGVLIDNGAGSGNYVLENSIGLNAAGTGKLGNSGNGLEIAGNNNVIGLYSGVVYTNFISANGADGVRIDNGATGNALQGNWIGLDAVKGTVGIGNVANGVEVLGSNNVIGSTTVGLNNVISANAGDGVLLDSTANANSVQGDYVGTDAIGIKALGNGGSGVEIAGTNNTVSGTTTALNVIAGNKGNGVLIDGPASGTLVQGSNIGVNAGFSALGNALYGVSISGNNNTIGGGNAGNVIASNTKGGVQLSAGSGNTVSQNSIYANGSSAKGPGIVMASGANNNVAAPTLSNAALTGSGTNTLLTVTVSFNAPIANVNYVIEVFANVSGDPEGQVYLGSQGVTPTSTGLQTFTFTVTNGILATDTLITATLTDASGNTSIFSNGVTA